MTCGILVYDKKDAKYNKWFIDHIIEVGKEYGLYIDLVLTEEIVSGGDEVYEKLIKTCDFAIMRNRNCKMSATFEEKGIKCFNSSLVCELGNDKWEMYRKFSEASIPVMYTQERKLPSPFVMKPRNGHGGENVYLVKSAQEFETVKKELADNDVELNSFIYQMVATEKGRDIRAYVVGDTILTAMERKAKDSDADIRANFSLGGEANEYALNEDELRLVAKVAKLLKPDFIGIDIIYNNGKPVVNEIEDAVGTRMLYSNTDIDPVTEYIKWIKENI